uniref:Uncharacterized protein n=1 Tax=Arundo donax TaxID=35708 RepID=A0A0A9ET94_ARUDO
MMERVLGPLPRHMLERAEYSLFYMCYWHCHLSAPYTAL